MSEREEPIERTEPETAVAPVTEDASAVGAPVDAEAVAEANAPLVREAELGAEAPDASAGEAGAATAAAVPVTIEAVTAEEAPPRRKGRPAKPSTLQPLPPYAIIETGGKQYRVSVGDVVSVEKLPVEAGSTIIFDQVLLLSGDGETRVGTPIVPGASVAATVEETYRGEKLIIFKMKAKKGYRRKTGHRQSLTRLAITAINA